MMFSFWLRERFRTRYGKAEHNPGAGVPRYRESLPPQQIRHPPSTALLRHARAVFLRDSQTRWAALGGQIEAR